MENIKIKEPLMIFKIFGEDIETKIDKYEKAHLGPTLLKVASRGMYKKVEDSYWTLLLSYNSDNNPYKESRLAKRFSQRLSTKILQEEYNLKVEFVEFLPLGTVLPFSKNDIVSLN